MSRWLRDRPGRRVATAIGVDRQQLAWIDRDASGATAVYSHDYFDEASTPWGEAWRRTRAAQAARDTVDVIAGNDLAVYWVQTPPAAVASLSELRQIAETRCTHLYGGSPEDWRVAGDWDAHHPFVCAALPQAVAARLDREFEQCNRLARWYTAWGVASASLAGAFPATGWSAMRSPTRLLLWHCRNGRVDTLTSLACEGTDDAVQLVTKARQHIEVERCRAERTEGDLLHWLDLVAPSKAATADGIVPIQPQPSAGPLAAAPRSEAIAALAIQALVQGSRA